MDNKVLLKYGDNVFKRFDKRLKAALNKPRQDDKVHDLRTNIKKLKAYLKLIRFIAPGFKYKKFFKPWKKLFKDLAGLRDWQVRSKVAKEKLNTPIATIIAKGSKTLPDLDSYDNIFGKNLYHKLLTKIESATERKPVSERIYEYNNDITLKIRELLFEDKESRRCKLHILRKHLKEYHYNLDVIRKGKILSADAAEIEAWLKQMMDLLGDWHDVRSLINEIQESIKKDQAKQPEDPVKRKAFSILIAIENQQVSKINRICYNRKRIDILFPVLAEI